MLTLFSSPPPRFIIMSSSLSHSILILKHQYHAKPGQLCLSHSCHPIDLNTYIISYTLQFIYSPPRSLILPPIRPEIIIARGILHLLLLLWQPSITLRPAAEEARRSWSRALCSACTKWRRHWHTSSTMYKRKIRAIMLLIVESIVANITMTI
jgi:hypothetical protein